MVVSNEFWIQIVIYALSFGLSGGALFTKIKHLEKKQDKHNKLIERMITVENKATAAHGRLDSHEKCLDSFLRMERSLELLLNSQQQQK